MRTPSLADRGISAAKWNFGGNGAKAALQFCFGILLARLLGPEAFGLIAIAMLMIGLGTLVSDLGFGAALIQRHELDRRDADFAFTIQVAIGLGLFFLGAAVSGPVSRFFGEPASAPVIQAMSTLFPIRALGQTARALLIRQLNFKGIQRINVGTYVAGYGGVGLSLAVAGYGVWSLVAAQLVQALLETGLLLFAGQTMPRLRMRGGSNGLLRFGGQVITANIGSWLILNMDSVVVGRSLGPALLGVYNRAIMLVAAPAHAVVSSLQGVLFAACARAGRDTDQMKRAYLATTSAVALICFPFFMAVAAVPETVVLALYGDKWRVAVPLLQPLAFAMLVHSLLALIGPVLMAADRTGREAIAQWMSAILMVPVLYFASTFSLSAVGWAVLLLYLLRLAFLFHGLVAAISIRPRELFAVIAYPALIGVLAFLAVSLSDASLSILPWIPRLLAAMLVAAITLATMVHLLRRKLFGGDLGRLLGERQMPSTLRRWIGNGVHSARFMPEGSAS